MQHHPRAASIAATVAGRDEGQLAATLTDTVRLRALLPGGPVESHGRDAVVARLRACGAELVGEVERYRDSYRLCYVRGPEGIIVELAERIG